MFCSVAESFHSFSFCGSITVLNRRQKYYKFYGKECKVRLRRFIYVCDIGAKLSSIVFIITVQMKKYGCTLQICPHVLTRAMVETFPRGQSTFSPWEFTARSWRSRYALEFSYFCTFSGGTLRTSRRLKKLRKKNIFHTSIMSRILHRRKNRNKTQNSRKNHRG